MYNPVQKLLIHRAGWDPNNPPTIDATRLIAHLGIERPVVYTYDQPDFNKYPDLVPEIMDDDTCFLGITFPSDYPGPITIHIDQARAFQCGDSLRAVVVHETKHAQQIDRNCRGMSEHDCAYGYVKHHHYGDEREALVAGSDRRLQDLVTLVPPTERSTP